MSFVLSRTLSRLAPSLAALHGVSLPSNWLGQTHCKSVESSDGLDMFGVAVGWAGKDYVAIPSGLYER
jgi:hypothetical protein